MNINPFELLKNAQNMQEHFGKMQEELKTITAVGFSGGGIVKVTVNGQMELTDIEIDPIAVDPRDIVMLQDLIVAAHKDALSNVREAMTSKLGPMMGNLNLPAGFGA